MIIVTGGTGALGSQIVQRLMTRVSPDRVGVSVRDTAHASDVAARGVRVRRGDFTDPGSLADAFDGATQVLIVSTNHVGEEAIAQHRAAIDAAQQAGVRRVLYTSHQGAAADSLFGPMRDHAATETYLASAGVAFTALRNGYYASTLPLLIGDALDTGELRAPADGPVSWTAHADLAEAAAAILTEEASFDGPTPPLTAPDALDLEDIAAILTDLTGRTIRRIVVADAEWTNAMIDSGVPDEQVRMLLDMFQASRRGEFAARGNQLAQILQRPPTPARAILDTAALPEGTPAR